jgi:hypothetical protein
MSLQTLFSNLNKTSTAIEQTSKDLEVAKAPEQVIIRNEKLYFTNGNFLGEILIIIIHVSQNKHFRLICGLALSVSRPVFTINLI